MINRKSVLSHAIDNGFDQTITGYPVILKYAQEKNVIDYTIEGNTVNANSSLPEAYRQLEYIESTGKQRLFTDILVNDCKGYELEFQSTGIVKAASNYNLDGIFGANNTGADSKVWFNYNADRTLASYNMTLLGAPSVTTPDTDITENYKTKHTIKIAVDGTVTYDGEILTQLTGFKEATKNIRLVFFGQEGFYSKTRIFSAKIYGESSKILRNYIPCYRIVDGFAGLYDTVSKAFFTNDSTGSFLKGPEVTKGVGDLDSESGKYIIPIIIQGKNTLTINALLDTPLNSGETANYKLDNLPRLSLFENSNTIKCDTTVPPASISVTYKTKVSGPYE